MLRTKSTINGKITARQNSGNTTHGLKIQRSTDAFAKKISSSIDQVLRSNFDIHTPNFACNGKSAITKPYEVSTASKNQEYEVKSYEVVQKPFLVSAVTESNPTSNDPSILARTTIAYSHMVTFPEQQTNNSSLLSKIRNVNDAEYISNERAKISAAIPIATSANVEINSAKIRNFFHAPIFRNFRTRKKPFRVPKYIRYNVESKSGQSFDVGTEKWATEQFSNRNFTSISRIPELKPTFAGILQSNCSYYYSTTILQAFNIPGLRKEHAQSAINNMANGKSIQHSQSIVIICTIYRIAVLDRIETSLRSGKSANVHIDSFSDQWDKSQLLCDGYLLGNMLHCLTLITGSTLRQDFYTRKVFLEVIEEIRENIYSTCKHLAFTQYNTRKKWIFRRVNLTTQQKTPARTSHQQLNTTTADATSKQQASLLDHTSNIPLHQSWQEFSEAPYPITPETFYLVPSISRLLNDRVTVSEISEVLQLIEPTQELSYRQFHVASSTMQRIAAVKHIFFHITNDLHPTRDSMMTAYNSYIKFPDPTFNMIAQYYLYAETRHQPPNQTPEEYLTGALFKILREIEDISSTFLTALHLESITCIPYPNLILDHPTLTHVISAPPTKNSNPVPAVNSPQSQFIAKAFCTASPDTSQLHRNIWRTDTSLTVADFCVSAPIQRLVADLPDPMMFFNVFEPIPIDAKLTSQVCTILINRIWRQTRICHICSALWQVCSNDSFIARDSIVDCYGHFCGYEDTVLHTVLQDSLDNSQALVAKPLVLRALQSIITDLGLIACDLLRLEYPVDQTQEDTTDTPISLHSPG